MSRDFQLPMLAHLPGWSQVWSRLEARHSLIVHGPKLSGHKPFAKAFLKVWRQQSNSRSLELHLPTLITAKNRLNPAQLLDQTAVQTGWDLSSTDTDPNDGGPVTAEFFASFQRMLEEEAGSTLVIVRGGRRGLEEPYHALISGFCELLSRMDGQQSGDLTLLVLDDYSMYFYENWRNQVSSFDLVPIYLRAPKARELARFLTSAGSEDPDTAAERLLETTGGHHGLILELLDALGLNPLLPAPESEARPDLSPLVDDDLPTWLEQGRILHDLQRLLAARSEIFCAEALRHQKARLFPPQTPDPQYLTEIGVLARSGMNRLVLCPGAITHLVEDMSRAVAKPDSETEAGAFYSPGELELGLADTPITDDDFLIVHLSDLHVGPEFRFHLTTQDFDGRKKAHELLKEDLDHLGIRRRIDALVVSGDFVEQGADFGQFQRARDVVEAIREDLELDPSRIIAVAGNHDLDWQPSDYAAKQPETGVSRENYETFYRLLGKEPCSASLIRLPSRGDGPALRLLGLDSNLVEGPDAGGIGYIGAEALEQAAALLREDEQAEDGSALTWIVVHHHLFPATSPGAYDALGKRISTFANASELLYHARRWNAEMVLHGHEHQPSITVAQRWSYPPRGHEPPFFPVISAGAGSFALGSHLGPIGRNHYYVIHRQKDAVCFHSRILDDHGAAFAYHDQVRVPLKTD